MHLGAGVISHDLETRSEARRAPLRPLLMLSLLRVLAADKFALSGALRRSYKLKVTRPANDMCAADPLQAVSLKGYYIKKVPFSARLNV